MTRVRFAGAKDLLSGSHTPSDRFEHCSHSNQSCGTQRHHCCSTRIHSCARQNQSIKLEPLNTLGEKFNRRNATPAKVLDSFEGSEELFLSVGRAYIATAALTTFFGMASLEDVPSLNKFPSNIVNQTVEDKKRYFYSVFEKFIDEYLLQKNVTANGEDYVSNYAMCYIFLTILILQLKDTAAEADGDRNLINQKLLLSVFKSMGAYSKYAIEMFVSIAQIECMLTSRMSEEFKWGFFVSWRGGAGNMKYGR